MEQVTGTLNGRSGSFILQHSATMTPRRTAANRSPSYPIPEQANWSVLTGTMNIKITDGKHSYDFEYTLPESH